MRPTYPVIVTETPDGATMPRQAWIAHSESDLLSWVRDACSRDDDVPQFVSVEAALTFLDERRAQLTRLIDRAEYRSDPLGWASVIDTEAELLGWRTGDETACSPRP